MTTDSIDNTTLEAPVEAKPVEERDELLRELLPRLDEDLVEDLWEIGEGDYKDALVDREEWERRIGEWEDQYHGNVPEKNFPWPGASNLHVPLTMLGVETLKPRLVETVLGADPPILVSPVESTDDERQERVELFLNWQILSELKIEPIVEESSHYFLTPGTVIAKVFWKVERTRHKSVRSFPVTTSMPDIFFALFGETAPDDFEKQESGKLAWQGTLPGSAQGGPRLEVKLKFKMLKDEIQVFVDREELVEHPQIDLIDPPDFVGPVNGGASAQKLPWCAQRLWLSEDDIRRKVKLGRFYQEAVDELLQRAPSGSEETAGENYRDTLNAAEGVDGDGSSNVRDTQYLVLEIYRRYDIDDDGFEEEIIYWISPDLQGKILGWDYLDNVYAHGRRPFIVGRYLKIPGRFYGLSFPQIIQNLQEEINAMHNQRVDFGTIQNLPMYFYRASSSHSPTLYKLRPGEGIPVDNPQQDILMPHWQGSPAFGQSEEALIYQYFERLTGLTDLALGKQPNRVGATRTASGTAQLLSEAGLRFKTSMESFQRFWVEIFEHILALDQQYLPPGKEFRVTGRLPEYIRLHDRAEIMGKYDIRLSANTETLNRSVQRDDASQVLQFLMQPSVMQSGLVNLRGIYRASRDFLKAFGKDPDAYLEIPQQGIIRTPDEELAMFISGRYDRVDPSPAEPVQEHLAKHSMQLRDPMVQRALGPGGLKALRDHIGKTQQIATTMQMAQQLQARPGGKPVVGEQARNAQIGRSAPNQPSPNAAAAPAGMPAAPGGAPGGPGPVQG